VSHPTTSLSQAQDFIYSSNARYWVNDVCYWPSALDDLRNNYRFISWIEDGERKYASVNSIENLNEYKNKTAVLLIGTDNTLAPQESVELYVTNHNYWVTSKKMFQEQYLS
jgi:hypothetical protein